MYRGPSRYYKVVVRSHDNRFSVWHADAPIMRSWFETGCYGSENECWDYIEERDGSQGFWFNFPGGD